MWRLIGNKAKGSNKRSKSRADDENGVSGDSFGVASSIIRHKSDPNSVGGGEKPAQPHRDKSSIWHGVWDDLKPNKTRKKGDVDQDGDKTSSISEFRSGITWIHLAWVRESLVGKRQ